jgi:hypothetical protein
VARERAEATDTAGVAPRSRSLPSSLVISALPGSAEEPVAPVQLFEEADYAKTKSAHVTERTEPISSVPSCTATRRTGASGRRFAASPVSGGGIPGAAPQASTRRSHASTRASGGSVAPISSPQSQPCSRSQVARRRQDVGTRSIRPRPASHTRSSRLMPLSR